MSRRFLPVLGFPGAGPGAGSWAYWQQVKAIRPANLLAYWRLNEASGTDGLYAV